MAQAEKRAALVKEALCALIREVAKDKEGKERMAKFLGKSYHAVEGMAYQQKGSFDSWINAVLFLFDLEAQDAANGVKELHQLVRKKRPLNESDKIWFEEIDQLFTEEDKIYWLSLMRYSAKLKRSN
jgi:hypothetical protein